jgi:hypothetical protein
MSELGADILLEFLGDGAPAVGGAGVGRKGSGCADLQVKGSFPG